MVEKELEGILKENDGSWSDALEYIGGIENPQERMELYIGIDPEVVGSSTYGIVRDGMGYTSKEIAQDSMGIKQKNDLMVLAGLEMAKRSNKLEKLAYGDTLTGLHNRRFFDKSLENQVALSSDGKRDVSLILFDVDKFKSFNDTYGHLAGDYVLKKLGSLLNDSMRRESDVCCRYGGEEFVVILPETDAAGAYAAAEYFRKAVEGQKWEYEGKDLGKVTVSLGISTYAESDVKKLVSQADDAMYKAKKSGRNKTVLA